VEKIIPTYSQGTVIPDTSDLICLKRESGWRGIIFKFHGLVEYRSQGFFSIVGKPLPWVVECMSAPYSTSTVSSRLDTSRQNSLSISSSVTGLGQLSTGSNGNLFWK
jgi:hypothetical protein